MEDITIGLLRQDVTAFIFLPQQLPAINLKNSGTTAKNYDFLIKKITLFSQPDPIQTAPTLKKLFNQKNKCYEKNSCNPFCSSFYSLQQ